MATTGSPLPQHSWHRRFEARVVVAVGVLVAASLGAVLAATTRTVTSRSLERASTDLEAARVAFNHLADDRAGFASSQVSLVAALPVFRAHMTDARLAGDLATLEALADEYRRQLKADFIIIGDPAGNWTAVKGWPPGEAPAVAIRAAIDEATAGRPARDFVPAGDHLYLVVSEPARFADEVLGTLTVGYALDDGVAARLAEETDCDVNIAAGGVLFASSLPKADRAALAARIASNDLPPEGAVTRVGASDYVVGAFPLSSKKSIHHGRLVLLENWRPTAQFVDEIRRRLLATGAVILALALAGSFVISRRMSQPLRDLAQAATDIADGNWERQVPLRGSVEATMTADAFNAMTTSLRHWHEEAKKRDDELRQAQKLEALGRLAGGIAHDFNNLLMAMRGYAELLLESLASDPRREEVQEIINAADRAAALTKQLLAFSRRQAVTPRVVALDTLVTRTEHMLQRLIGAPIALTTIVPAGIDTVRADASQLEQVVMNLTINARDAMPDGGRLLIELANVAEDAHRPPQLAPGRYVRLSVTDTGSGMTPETRARIFEPFFTTKDVGHGTGLGLAMVYGIVEQSGGAIDVVTALNQGTTFHLYLPAVKEVQDARGHADAEAAAALLRKIQNVNNINHLKELSKVHHVDIVSDASHADHVTHVNQRGSETVLLVEDEASVGKFIANALRAHGYTVLEASNAEEALEIVHAALAPIHLLLTDVVMPGINGRELSEIVVRLQGNTRVLFMSGYAGDAVLRHGIATAGTQFLQKPFSIDALTTKIRETLGSGL